MVVAVVVLGVLLALSLGALIAAGVRLRVVSRHSERLRARVEALESGDEPPRTRSERAVDAVRSVIGGASQVPGIVRTRGMGGLLMTSIDQLSTWAMDDRGEIDRLAADDGTVSILFSDIEGSTTLNTELGDEAFVTQLIAHDTMVRAHVERYRGHIVKSQGDGFMIVFTKATRAVRAGLAIQRSFSETWSRALRRTPVSVRIGIHTGTVVARAGDYFGRNVAMAARVGAAAEGGQMLVTSSVADELGGDERFRLTPGQRVELKGLPGKHQLYVVTRGGRRLPDEEQA
ncbi:hypothetical protein GCM10011519_13920 [Marmoricola endophyticus]|uniref:Guanylate cyclase domain-containing protein n=1 Tax=Marmoricola endophyticus TaxID=2040280 RepID=A0A917F2A2_9ACTN|nr:adenylate/guanylate cyclase domain-containing protein [Marmoricola endophyticus]GGF41365.1 hypothetical protein GCM10011519_13920 [Marmoricola endophyticus]